MHLYIFFLSLRNRTELLKSGTMLEEILAYNKQFVENKGYESYITNKYPDKKIAILSCMDTRLTALLPAALGIKNGDVKMIKNAGGACHMHSEVMLEKMKARGINPDYIDMMRFCGVDFHSWLDGFEDTEKSVRGTVDFIVRHPLIPSDVTVYGFIIDSTTGELTRIV